MISKLSIVEEETDESIYWLELLVDAGVLPSETVHDLVTEATEILAMTVASIKTMRNPKSKI